VSGSGWRRRSSRTLFESPWFQLRQDAVSLPGGEEITYTFVEHGGYVVVVPLQDDGRVVMERVYRYTIDRDLLECPSGGSDGDPPEVAARRELEEETGYRTGHLERLGSFYGSTGISNERYEVFLATQLSADGRVRREITEQIEVVLLPLDELLRRALAGEIEDGPSALAILLAASRVGAKGPR
jgi:ADP-ribose pyrophosphatase